MGARRWPLGLRIEQVDGVWVAWADVDRHPVWRVSCALVAQGRRVVVRELRVSLKPSAILPAGGLPPGVLSLPAPKQKRGGSAMKRAVERAAQTMGLAKVLSPYVAALPKYWAPRRARLRPGLRGLERVFPFMVGEEAPRGRWARAERPTKPRGRPALSEEHLLRVSVAYVTALDGGSRHPVQDAAKQLAETPGRIRDLLNKARRRGLLTHPLRGSAGGQLTPRARAVQGSARRTRR